MIYWPGTTTLDLHSVDEIYLPSFDFIVRSGRAVALPIFKGAFDRDDASFSITVNTLWPTPESTEGTRNRDFQIKWLQDFSRTIDYLESRDDFDTGRLGYYGVSWGGFTAPIVLAIEGRRIDAAVVRVGGLDVQLRYLPEADPFNFVPRVHTPLLMINGEYDVVYPFETAQKPMFDLLGTDPHHKKHVVMPAAHVVPRDAHIRETLDWFDRYLVE